MIINANNVSIASQLAPFAIKDIIKITAMMMPIKPPQPGPYPPPEPPDVFLYELYSPELCIFLTLVSLSIQ